MAKQYEYMPGEWQSCAVCGGKYKAHKTHFKVRGVKVCAWCKGRGANFLLLFIQFAQQMAKRNCEHGVPSPECRCAPCTAKKIIEFRQKTVGDQEAPVNVR